LRFVVLHRPEMRIGQFSSDQIPYEAGYSCVSTQPDPDLLGHRDANSYALSKSHRDANSHALSKSDVIQGLWHIG
jgi:hypothetical protein